MPLVPKHTYEAWFSRRSWVYQAYAYLFANPLWSRKVPNGASLCPAFWLAIFSLTIFRVFVYAVLALRLLAKVLRLGDLLRWTDSVVAKTLGMDEMPIGVQTLVGSWLISVVGVVLFGLGTGVYDAASAGVLLPAAAFIINAIVALVCHTYCAKHKGEDDRCPVEWYLRTSLVATLVLLAVFHPAQTFTTFVLYPLAAVKWVIGLFATFGGWLWTGLTWIILGIIHGAFGALLAVGIAVALAAAGYIASRFYPLDSESDDLAAIQRERYLRNVEVLVEYLNDYTPYLYSQIRRALPHCPTAVELAHSGTDVTREMVAALMDKIGAELNAYADAEEARRSKASALCCRASGALAALFSPVMWCWKQGRILLSYLWALAKSRKSRACPYLVFHD